eukprot:2140780-Lingulodinium_polyedra.AAC.1
MTKLLAAMKIPRVPLNAFLLDSAQALRELGLVLDSELVQDREPKGARSLADPVYKDKHCELFRLAGHVWPPCNDVLDEYKEFAGFGERVLEMIHFCDKTWGAKAEFEVIDLNPSLGRLLAFSAGCELSDLRTPWRQWAPTITSNSKLAVRISQPGKPK